MTDRNIIRETLATVPARGYTRLITMLAPSVAPNDEMLYLVTHIRDVSTELVDLEGGGLLAVRVEGTHVSFVVFSLECGDSLVVGTEEPKTPGYYSVVFWGEGPSDSLRELRHTYWGQGGYIYYPNGKLIADAFVKLDRWFDCD